MAIDTAEKRRSAANVCRHWSGSGVTPNVLKDLEWRQQVGAGYSGVATGGGGGSGGPSTPGPDNYIIRRRRRRA